jgi:hypothetical protein
MSVAERSALVVVTPQMLERPYHTRYELIEFAVYTLAARVQSLVPLHAGCVGIGGRGVILMGSSGAGKSTVALHSVLGGLELLSEDSVFVQPNSLLATGIANYLHVRNDSLRWLTRTQDLEVIRQSPVIVRRSGVKKYEVNLRNAASRSLQPRLARKALQIAAVAFLTPQTDTELLRPLGKSEFSSRLSDGQEYAAGQNNWRDFRNMLLRVPAYELRRRIHPMETVAAIRGLLDSLRG